MPTLFEAYTSGESSQSGHLAEVWGAQTFTPLVAHRITEVRLLLARAGLPGLCTASIRATDPTDPDRPPTGPDLATGTFDGDALTEGLAWQSVPLSTTTLLVPNTRYAIIWRAPNAVPSQSETYWGHRLNSGEYPRGDGFFSGDAGVTWIRWGSDVWPTDQLFEEWGVANSMLHVPIGGKASAGVVAARNS